VPDRKTSFHFLTEKGVGGWGKKKKKEFLLSEIFLSNYKIFSRLDFGQ